jgi:hypothetical protein
VAACYYSSKQKLNYELYKTHLKAAQEWGGMWGTILSSINDSLDKIMEKKYSSLDKKISKLVQTQISKPTTNTQFHPRVVNKTSIPFTEEEMKLLNKGLKYNLSHKRKHWLSNFALEAEAVITLLHTHELEYVRYQVAHNLQKLYGQQ